MAERTENYALALWGAEDKMEREMVNGNWESVDGALGGKCEVVFGSFTGDASSYRMIDLGFCPKAVIQMSYNGSANASGSVQGGLFGPNYPLRDVRQTYISVSDNGFILMDGDTNTSGKVYYYAAFH